MNHEFQICLDQKSRESSNEFCGTRSVNIFLEENVEHRFSIICVLLSCIQLNTKSHSLFLWGIKTGRREVPGSFLGLACRPKRLKFSVVLSETHVNTGQDPLERPPRRPFHIGPGSTSGQLALKPTTTDRPHIIMLCKQLMIPYASIINTVHNIANSEYGIEILTDVYYCTGLFIANYTRLRMLDRRQTGLSS